MLNRRWRELVVLVSVIAFSLWAAGSSLAWELNVAQLDPGTCYTNLQLGSDKTASKSATPSFLLWGDGGAARYDIFIDSAYIGTFNSSDVFGNVCIQTTVPLADGPHRLTGNELQPHPTYVVVPFNFTVDTVPAPPPSKPTIASFRDSGVLGDNITKFTSLWLNGTAQPNISVQLFGNTSVIGGTLADANGNWSVTTNPLNAGTYAIRGITMDTAGNKSDYSETVTLTIDPTLPTANLTPANGATVAGTVNVDAAPADNTAVWKVEYRVDGVLKATPFGPFNYSWNTTSLANGTHTIAATTYDVADNSITTTNSVNVQNGSATIPGAPTLGSATGGDHAVTLNWSAPASDGGSPITGYKIYRGTASGGETLLTTVVGLLTSYIDTSALNGVTYYYQVAATNLLGEGPRSNERSALPAATLTAPSAPTLNSATAGNGSVSLAWSAPSSDGGSPVTGYKVYRGTTSGGETLLTTLVSLATGYTDTTALNGITYYYQVSATNLIGESGRSNERSATPVAPATAPGAPTLNSATAGNASVSLAWSAPSSDGGSAITGYRVYRGTSSGGETLLTTLGNVTGYIDNTAANGITYYYQVSALNSVGEGGRSNERNATPVAPATVPGAPTLNTATAGNGNVSLAWSAPVSNGGSAITGYRVYRGTFSGGETFYVTLGNVTSYTDFSASNGTTFYYQVTALNSVGEGGKSNERSATPATTPGAPTLDSATPGTNSITLAWTATSNGGSPITGYKVYRSSFSGGETLYATLGNVTGYTDTAATPGITYYYKVTALNSLGESALSNERFASSTATATVPGAPTLNPATAGNASVALSWTAPASNGGSAITGYKVYRGTFSGGETLLTTLGNVTGYTDNTAANGTTYYYQVSALNAIGEGARSPERSATPSAPASTPGAPNLLGATGGNGSVVIFWNAPSSDGGSPITGYKVYRSTFAGGETLFMTLGNVTNFGDTNVVNGITYYYQVTAVNSAGESVRSVERNATPSAPLSAPGAPTLNSATAGNGSVSLAWSAPSSDGGSSITGYRVYRGTFSGGETSYITLGNVTSYTDFGASNGTTFYYQVTALNSVGESSKSNERSATPSAPATAPGAPTLDSATPGTNSVSLGWSAPASNGGSAITGYKIYRSTSSGNETLLTTVGNITGYTDSTATYGATYYYQVAAVNSVGESTKSNERFATPTATLTVPGAPNLYSAAPGNGSVTLNWTAPANGGSPITGYRLYRGTSGGGLVMIQLGNVSGYTDTTVVNGTTYSYQVAAVNALGEGQPSNIRSATPAAPVTVPGAPTLNTATAGNGSVTLNWTAPASDGGSPVTGYRVYRGSFSGGETSYVTLGNVTGYTDFGAANGTTYYYQVTAVNAIGESLTSNERSATPAAAASAPGAPTLDAATPGTGTVSLAWTAPSNDGGSPVTGYRVYRGSFSGGETLLTTLGNTTSYTDTGLANGASYYYQVTALNGVGEGARSSELSATTPTFLPTDTTPPSKPASMKILVVGTSQMALDWPASTDNVGVTGYRVYRDGNFVATATTTNYVDSGLAAGSTHSYYVRAVDAAGNLSVASSTVSSRCASLGSGSTGTLSGVVYNQAGTPLANAIASLTVNGTTKTGKTNNTGVWKISSLPAGTYTVSVSLSGYTTQSFTMTVVAKQTLLEDVTL